MFVAACAAPSIDGFGTSEIGVDGFQLEVLVAETSAQRHQGLRMVDQLPSGVDGMLFVYDQPASATFGMLDTLIALDIWWFDEDGHLLASAEMEPCSEEPCTDYRSPGPVMWVLETPHGDYVFGQGARLEFSNVENP